MADVEAWGQAAEQAPAGGPPADELRRMQRLAQTYGRARSVYAQGAPPWTMLLPSMSICISH